MAFTIKFKQSGEEDPTMEQIRKAARADGWAGITGLKEWAKENYNATLRYGVYGTWTSISFKTEEDMLMFTLRHVGVA